MLGRVAACALAALGCGAGGGQPDGQADSTPPPIDASTTDGPYRPGPIYVLFDATKHERAGNADWVIDDSGRYPMPAEPAVESDWHGAISSWGFELHRTGRYFVEELPSGARITHGDPGNAQDLSRYDVFVVVEPNSRFTAAEAEAVVAFVRQGGGLFMVANHGGSDRNGDGWDPPGIWNDLYDRTGNPFGIRFAGDDIDDSPDNNIADSPQSQVLHGDFGHVLGVTYYDGSTMTIDAAANPTVTPLIWQRGAPQGASRVTFAVAELGGGRAAAIGDSAPADDGTGTGMGLINGWNDPRGSNRELFLNATAWLAKD